MASVLSKELSTESRRPGIAVVGTAGAGASAEAASEGFAAAAGGGGNTAKIASAMDKAVFTFESPDRVRSRWTWYQDGKEKWFEEIVQTRRP